MADTSIWAKVSGLASDVPGMMISIGSGFAGLLMPSPSGTAAANLLSDPDVLNGIVRIAQGAGVAVDAVKGLLGGGKDEKKRPRGRSTEIPLIETKT